MNGCSTAAGSSIGPAGMISGGPVFRRRFAGLLAGSRRRMVCVLLILIDEQSIPLDRKAAS
jgi:hypothetical protein